MSHSIKIWNKTQDGTDTIYKLNKEYNFVWYSNVFKRDGRWTFNIGRRFTGKHHSNSIKSWKNLITAQKQALNAIEYQIQHNVGGIDINREDYYDYKKPKDRTEERLLQLSALGLYDLGFAQFGIDNIISGIYIEKVWHEEDWNGYIDWIMSVLKKY